MIPFTTKIAWAYLVGSSKERSLATITLICLLSIGISTFALALGMSIAHGFKFATEQQFQTVHPTLTLDGYSQELMYGPLAQTLQTIPEVIVTCPYVLATILVGTPQEQNFEHALTLKGVNPKAQEQVSTLARKTTTIANTTFAQVLESGMVCIGTSLAQELDVHLGDVLTIAYTEQENVRAHKMYFQTNDVRVGGIFSTGIETFDYTLMLCDLKLFNAFFPERGITHVDLQLQKNSNLEHVKKKIAHATRLRATSWHDLYPALLAALTLEQYAAGIIFGLIMLIASMLIFALTYMQLTHKKKHIALYKAMGISDATVGLIFLQATGLIAAAATTVGLLGATACAYAINNYKLIMLPDAYYVTHLPAVMTWQIVAGIVALVLVLTCCAVYIPLRTTVHMNISSVARQEQ